VKDLLAMAVGEAEPADRDRLGLVARQILDDAARIAREIGRLGGTTTARLSAITLAPRTSIVANASVSAASTATPRGPGTPMPSAIRMAPSAKAPFGVIATALAPACAAWR
jgi:hypothetical protein